MKCANHSAGDFFASFQQRCTVRQGVVEFRAEPVSRRLEPRLHVLACSPSSRTNKQYELREGVPLTFNLSAYIHPKLSQLHAHSSHIEPSANAIRSSSLIALSHHESPVKDTPSIGSRRPGFIRRAKSFVKRESSLQISKIGQFKGQCSAVSPFPGLMRQSPRQPTLNEQMLQSKERIAKIRRQLTEIYQLRNRPLELRLRLL